MKAAYVVGDVATVQDVPDLDTPQGPVRSNNVAEYAGLILLLKRLREQNAIRGNRTRYAICGDSELVIRQMRGEYRIRAPNLLQLHAQAKELSTGLDVEFRWVPRDRNIAGRLLAGRNRSGSTDMSRIVPES